MADGGIEFVETAMVRGQVSNSIPNIEVACPFDDETDVYAIEILLSNPRGKTPEIHSLSDWAMERFDGLEVSQEDLAVMVAAAFRDEKPRACGHATVTVRGSHGTTETEVVVP